VNANDVITAESSHPTSARIVIGATFWTA